MARPLYASVEDAREGRIVRIKSDIDLATTVTAKPGKTREVSKLDGAALKEGRDRLASLFAEKFDPKTLKLKD